MRDSDDDEQVRGISLCRLFDENLTSFIPTLVIHHSFSLSLEAQNLPFEQILPTVDFFYLLDCLTISGLDRTYYAHYFIFSCTFSFLVYPSAFYCTLNTHYRIVSYYNSVNELRFDLQFAHHRIKCTRCVT